MRCFLTRSALPGVLVLFLSASAWSSEDTTGLRFQVGMAALDAALATEDVENRDALLDEAIKAFRTILIDRPGLVRVRLELARVFFLKEDDTLARRHFEQVLAGDVPDAVAANVQRFLDIMRARRRWEAHFGAAVAPDSNLNAASGTQTIFLDTPFGRLPFTLDRAASPKSGLGLSVWGGGEYQAPLTDRLRLRAGADASMLDYKGGDFDRHSASAHLGPRWLIDARTEASLLATASRQWTAGMPETDRYGLRLEAEHLLTPRLTVVGQTSVARRDCRDCDWLDGPVGNALIGASWAALPILRLDGNAGWNWSRADVEHWRSRGPRAGLGATLALPAGFTVGLRASVQRTEYQGQGFAHNTIDQEPRVDRIRSFSVSAHNRAWTAFGFSPRLSLINERRDTNAQALDYRRNRAELSLVRQF